MSPRHAALVLAAGAGVRFGGCKQLLTRDGEALVHRAVRLALATAPARMLVTVGAHADAVLGALAALPCTPIRVADWRTGMAASLRAAAAWLEGFDGAALVLACDQPALDAGHLLRLVEGASHAPSGAAATLHGAHPGTPAVVPARWFRDPPQDGDRGFGRRLRALPRAALFALDAPELRLDIDTPPDAAEAIARGWLDAEPIGVAPSRPHHKASDAARSGTTGHVRCAGAAPADDAEREATRRDQA